MGQNITQLKPCRFAALTFNTENPSPEEEEVFEYTLHGVDIANGPVGSYDCKNYSSVLSEENRPKMDKIINGEISNGILTVVPNKPQCIHALGAVPKPEGNIRPITSCTCPEGKSLNSKMVDMDLSFRYKSVYNVVELLKKDDYMSIIDLKSAYRCVSVNPQHTTLQGLCWCIEGEDKFLVENCLCFGAKCGPFYFNALSNFVYRKLLSLYSMKVVNYLDDYIRISSSYDECLLCQRRVISLLRFLGFQISWSKVTPPSKSPTYLGIEVDSNLLELRLPKVKLQKLVKVASEFARKKSA